MTYISAEAVDGGEVFMRSDLIMTTYDEQGTAVGQSPLPKMMILDPNFVIGVAGDDPVGAMINLLVMWDDCDDSSDLRELIRLDGDLRRDYLLLTSNKEVWTYREGEWEGPRLFGWIGSSAAKKLHNPEPFNFNIADQPPKDKEAHAQWARDRGFDERTIDEVVSGRSARIIGPEIAQLNAMRGAGAEVGRFMIEARIINGQFRFNRMSVVKVFGSPILSTEEHVLQALLGDWMSVSHFTRSATDEFPASLTIEFAGARVTFMPCRNRGNSHRIEFLNPADQPELDFFDS